MVNEFITEKTRQGIQGNTLYQIKHSVEKIFGDRFQDRKISELTQTDILDYIHGLDYDFITRHSILKWIKVLFNFCESRCYVLKNPIKTVKIRMQTDEAPIILRPETVESLMLTCLDSDPKLAPFLAVQLFGGVRAAESARLTAHEVSPTVIRIECSKAKTRRRRIIYPNETLQSWLRVAPYETVNSKNRFNAVRRKAGCYDGWPKNGMRHSFCSYSVAKYGARVTAESAGHSEQILFAFYRELVTREDAEKYWKICA